jgi:hypothetical protein
MYRRQLDIVGLTVTIALPCAAEEPPARDAAACGSPLAPYDPNRELGLGEAVPEEPGQPLRRFLYLNMKDSSACPPIGTGDPRGIIVLDIDHHHRFFKRIGSEMMMKGATDVSNGPGVRWMDGNPLNDRLYYEISMKSRIFGLVRGIISQPLSGA